MTSHLPAIDAASLALPPTQPIDISELTERP